MSDSDSDGDMFSAWRDPPQTDETKERDAPQPEVRGVQETKPTVRPATPTPATIARPPVRRTQEEIDMSANINVVADGIIVKSLERNYMDNQTAQRCMSVMNYATPSLMDPRVQAILISQNPDLESAFANKMIRGFAFGINRTALTMCNGLMLASIARVLLNECLSKMGLQAKGREQLLAMTQEVRHQMDIIADRTNDFVKIMARNIKVMGTVQHLLRYEANVDTLLAKIAEINLSVTQNVAAMDEASFGALDKITSSCDYIQSQLQSDDKLAEKKHSVDRSLQQWEAQQDIHKSLFDAYYEKQCQMEFQRATFEGRHKLYQRQLKSREKDMAYLLERGDHLNASIGRFEQMKADLDSDQADELKENTSIKRMALEAATKEIEVQQKSYDDQIRRLQKRASKLGMESTEYRAKSLTASDGTELYITKKRHGRWFWTKRTEYKEERRATRPNEKKRLEDLAVSSEQERQQVEQEIQRLRNERGEVERRVRSRMAQQSLLIAKDNEEYTSKQHGKRLRQIDQQIVYFKELRKDVDRTKRETEEKIQELTQRITEAESELSQVERKIANHKLDDNPDKRRMNIAERKERQLAADHERLRQEYEHMVKTFGIESGQDFAAFMKVFRMLNTASQNLPQAMRLLSKSFQGAYETFNSEFFKEDIVKHLQTEDARRRCLMDTASDMQAICEVGWEYFEAPLQNLIRVDSTMVLSKLIEDEKRKAIEDGSSGGVVIEAVEDDVRYPPVAMEYQEHDAPRR